MLLEDPGDFVLPGFHVSIQTSHKKSSKNKPYGTPRSDTEIYDVFSSQHGAHFLQSRKIKKDTAPYPPSGSCGSPEKRSQKLLLGKELVYGGMCKMAASSEFILHSSCLFDHLP